MNQRVLLGPAILLGPAVPLGPVALPAPPDHLGQVARPAPALLQGPAIRSVRSSQFHPAVPSSRSHPAVQAVRLGRSDPLAPPGLPAPRHRRGLLAQENPQVRSPLRVQRGQQHPPVRSPLRVREGQPHLPARSLLRRPAHPANPEDRVDQRVPGARASQRLPSRLAGRCPNRSTPSSPSPNSAFAPREDRTPTCGPGESSPWRGAPCCRASVRKHE